MHQIPADVALLPHPTAAGIPQPGVCVEVIASEVWEISSLRSGTPLAKVHVGAVDRTAQAADDVSGDRAAIPADHGVEALNEE
jgi:hypothetical protein